MTRNARDIAAAEQALKTAQYHLDACDASDPAFVVADHKRHVAAATRKLNKLMKG